MDLLYHRGGRVNRGLGPAQAVVDHLGGLPAKADRLGGDAELHRHVAAGPDILDRRLVLLIDVDPALLGLELLKTVHDRALADGGNDEGRRHFEKLAFDRHGTTAAARIGLAELAFLAL